MFVMPACFNAGDTIYFPFDTYDSSGASVTITGLATSDIEVYKNGSTTQRSSDSGYALLDTDGIDFDSTTGLHGFSIDTSDNTDAGFWADGAQYWVNVNAITVDGQTVRFTYFLPLGYSLRPTTAGRKLDVSSGGEAGIDWANIGSATTTVNLSGTTIKTATDVETDTNELQADWTNGGRLDLIVDAILADTNELQTDWVNGGRLDLIVDAILADTNELQTDWVNGGRLDLIVDAILADTGTDGVVIATGQTVTALTITTLTVTNNAIAWNANWDAEVQSEVQDAIEANHLDHLLAATYDPASKPGAADALLNELIENDGGVSRFTENALEQAPGGGASITNYVSVPAATIANLNNKNYLTITRYSTFAQGLTALGNVANKSATYFMIKESVTDADNDALVWIDEATGLIRINGSTSGVTAANGNINWTNTTTGAVTITLQEAETGQLVARKGLYWSIKVVRSTGVVEELVVPAGRVDVLDGAIRAVT